MSSDHIDGLALCRARRNRDRRPLDVSAGDGPPSTEQEDAIARARESWALSQLGREALARRRLDAGAPGNPVEQALDAPGGDH